jgi:nickel transport protein
LKLELVPVINPTTLKTGENATFKLLREGEPVPNAAVALVRGGSNERVYQNTDADGVATFTVSAAGKYLLAATLLTPGKEGEPWQGLFSTFTFEAR